MARSGLIVAVGMLGLLAGCNRGGGSAPVGQVVATVDGEEITSADLSQELSGASAGSDPKAQKQMQSAALQAIINRRIVAKAAHDQKLDATPAFAVQKRKTEDLTLINLLERKLAGDVPAPSPEEVERFIAEHPNSFAQRKLFVIDQVIAPAVPRDVLMAMRPLTTLPQVTQLLDGKGVEHQGAVSAIDGATVDPNMVAQIAKLPAGEIFVVPNGRGVIINQIRETRIVPFTGDRATATATAMLKQRRTGEVINKQMATLIAEGSKKVRYNDAYKPDPAAARPAQPASGGAKPASAAATPRVPGP